MVFVHLRCGRCILVVMIFMFTVAFAPHVNGQMQCLQPDECQSEPNGTFLPCYGEMMSALSCSYARVLKYEVPVVHGWDFPGSAENLTLGIYFFDFDGICYPKLNISWQLKPDGSLRYLTGFMLRLVDLNGIANITRVFRVDFSSDNLTPDQVHAVFSYPCITPNYQNGSSYRVVLQSLPAYISPTGSCSNCVEKYVKIPSVGKPEDSSPESTFYWTPAVAYVEVRGDQIIVSFQTAPVDYLFSSYQVDLVRVSGQSVYNDVAGRLFVNTTDYKLVSVAFSNVNVGVYKVWVRAVSLNDCTCRVGPNLPDDCRDVCTVSGIGPLSVMLDVEPLSVTTDHPQQTTETSHVQLVVGVVVGVTVAVVLLGLTAFLVYRHNSGLVKPMIYLVYMFDSDRHHQVVLKLAAFLRKHCATEVEIVDMLGQSVSRLDALLAKLLAVNRVVVIHSEGRKIDQEASSDPQNFLFKKVLQALQQTESCTRNNLIHVSFHYTSPDFVRDVKFGAKFRLVAELVEFIEVLNGGIAHTCTHCVEGPDLLQAFVEAGGLKPYCFEIAIVPPILEEDLEKSSINSASLEERFNTFETDAEVESTGESFICAMDRLIMHGSNCLYS